MPANNLIGLELVDGWVVTEKIASHANTTGGHFSVGYIAKKSNEYAFVKAFDFSDAFSADDVPTEIQRLSAQYNFERDVLNRCKDHRLGRVVVPIGQGSIISPVGTPPINKVFYLIFARAEGDIRNPDFDYRDINIAICLRTFHQSAVGLEQLHSRGIFHQDLKPSNVLIFDDVGAKLSDLGTSNADGLVSGRDRLPVAGDRTYAPVDRLYSRTPPTLEERKATDLYLLGSMFFYYFSNTSAMSATMLHVNKNALDGDWDHDFPFFEHAFYDAVTELRDDVELKSDSISSFVVAAVREMCEPDPRKRGDKKAIKKGGDRFSIRPFVSRLDMIATKAEIAAK